MKIIIAVMMLASIALLSIASFGPRRYCISEMRISTDREAIESAVRQLMVNQRFSISKEVQGGGRRYFVPYEVLEYRDMDGFFAANPDCCEITSHSYEGSAPSIFQRVAGNVSGFVKISYMISYRENEGDIIEEKKITRYVAIDRCGRCSSGGD